MPRHAFQFGISSHCCRTSQTPFAIKRYMYEEPGSLKWIRELECIPIYVKIPI